MTGQTLGHCQIILMWAAIFAALLAPSSVFPQSSASAVVISQIYGGGGNTGATLRNDFVELFNRGQFPVDVAGWTLQYASSSGTTWTRAPLNGVIQPGRYYLIALAQGSGGAVSLPAPDAVGNANLSATSGKVALVSDSGTLAGSAPLDGPVVDFVGYGDADAGKGSPAPRLSNITAAVRRSGGCQDTGNNAADFEVLPPNPRNSSAAANRCGGLLPEVSAAGVANAASYAAGAVAPGEIVVIFGLNLGPSGLVTLKLTSDGRFVDTTLAGTRVLFDGVAAPLIYVSSAQLSAVVPQSVAERNATEMWVEFNGQASNRISIP